MSFKVNKDLVGASQKELLEKMRNGELEAPVRGTPERADFDKFIAAAPGSDERLAFADDSESNDDPDKGQAPDHGSKDGDVEPPSGEQPEAPPTDNDTPPPPDDSDDEDEWLGYGSKQAMIDAHKNLFKSIEQKQKEVNKLRSTGGKQGRKIKDLEAQIKSQTERMESIRQVDTGDGPAGETGELRKPVRPKRPRATDYEDGEVDERYEEDLRKWEEADGKFPEQLENYYEKLQKRSMTHLEDKLKKVEERSEEAYRYASEERDREAETMTQKAWGDMWEDANAYQQQLGLQTKTGLSQINDAVLDLGSKDADAKAAAETFIKSLPKGDYEKFQKMRDVLNGMYSFKDGLPKKAFPNLQAALWSISGPDGKPLAEKYADVTVPKRNLSHEQARAVKENVQRRNESESALPADGQGAHDKRIDQPQTQSDKLERLRELSSIRRKNIHAFDGNRKMYDEYRKLVHDLGFLRGRGADS